VVKIIATYPALSTGVPRDLQAPASNILSGLTALSPPNSVVVTPLPVVRPGRGFLHIVLAIILLIQISTFLLILKYCTISMFTCLTAVYTAIVETNREAILTI